MFLLNSKFNVDDGTGIKLVYCIKIINSFKRKFAYLGEIILSVIKKIYPKKFHNKKHAKKFKFLKPGKICKAFIIRSKFNFKRTEGIFIKFNQNAVVIVNSKGIPITNRIRGPMIYEICVKYLSLGCISSIIV